MATAYRTVSGTQIKDHSGQQYGSWTVLRYDHSRNRDHYWLCRCQCGSEVVVVGTSLRSGKSRQCILCGAKDRPHQDRRTKTVEYSVWRDMIQRCENPKNCNYERYGARGIRVCRRWREDFTLFLADMGKRPSPKHSIERNDNEGDYGPDNCRWATKKQQQRNMRSNHLIAHNGKTQCISAWAEEYGIEPTVLHGRVGLGWEFGRALMTPARKYSRYN